MTNETEQKTDEQRAKDFVRGYEELCDKHQMRVVSNPLLKLRDDGTYSLIVQNGVDKLK